MSCVFQLVQEFNVAADSVCRICSGLRHPTVMLVCETCKTCTHAYCVQPSVQAIPKGDWFCDDKCEVCITMPDFCSTISCLASVLVTFFSVDSSSAHTLQYSRMQDDAVKASVGPDLSAL